ncbi:MAG: PBP1A family penicillin-binding protein [bacterium]
MGKSAGKKGKKSRRAKKKPKKKARGARRVSCVAAASILLFFLVVLAGMMSAVIVIGVMRFARDLPDAVQGPLPIPKKTTKVYAANGELLANLYVENREYARIGEVPEMLQLAVIAIEDERFFFHRGVDFIGVTRAMVANLRAGRTVQGGSTITQQLARYLYLSPERTVQRKITEMKYSLALERRYSKQQILEYYLNMIYFGHGAYGVKTAARTYFGKKLGDLTIAECAMLASLPKSPSAFSPYRNPAGAMSRRNTVIAKMFELNFITGAQYEQAAKEPFNLAPLAGPGYENYRAPFFVTYVIEQLKDPDTFGITPTHLHTEGYRIYTTLDPTMQKAAQDAVARAMKLAAEQKVNLTQAAVVAIEPQTGKILAMVGGADYRKSKFNRAWQALRQPGSAFKPFVYAAAIQQGYPMECGILDAPVCFPAIPKTYCPKNYDHKYRGAMNFVNALVHSRNVPAVKVGFLVGARNVVETAKAMGIESELFPTLSLPLGTSEVTVLEMATAYSALANGGYRIAPAAIERITDDSGTVIYERKYEKGEKVLDDNVIARLVPVMQEVINRGTGTRAKIERPAAGKTGTTSDYRDAWFIGFTPQLTAAVWVGNDDNSPLRAMVGGKPAGRGIAGGTIPAPVWKLFMERALNGKEPLEFNLPERVPMVARNLAGGATGTEYVERSGEGPQGSPPLEHLGPDMLRFDTGERIRAYPEGMEPVEPEEEPAPDEDILLFTE